MPDEPAERGDPRPPINAADVPPRAQATLYPMPFAGLMQGREKRALGDPFGLRSFGVNLTKLKPGAQSALKHEHSTQDEFIYVLAGEPTLIIDKREYPLTPGMCCGFAAGFGSHHLINRGVEIATYLEIGDRSPNDEVFYPEDDIQVRPGPDGKRRFEHKDGQPY